MLLLNVLGDNALNNNIHNVPPRRAAAPRPRRRPAPVTHRELCRRMTEQADCFGMLVQFVHPFEEPDDRWPGPAEAKLLGKLREWAGDPKKHAAFGRKLSEKIRRHAGRKLPFPGACLIASGRQQKRLGRQPVRRWRGAALDSLAVLAQSSSSIWMRDKEPQLERVAADGPLRAVTLLLPPGFDDARLSPPFELEQP